MAFITYYPYVRFGLRWIGSTARCIKAKEGAGRDINIWDIVDCVVDAFDDQLPDMVSYIDGSDRSRGKGVNK